MINYDLLREQWIAERPRYECFLRCVVNILKKQTRARGVACTIQGRTKDIGGFIKKAFKNDYADPWTEVTDKAGARIVVDYQDDARVVCSIIEQAFDIRGVTDKTGQLGKNLLGYRGIHFDVALLDRDLIGGRRQYCGMACEVQVNTAAERAWADVSHRLIYKPAQEAATSPQRMLNRLVALVEIFDDQVLRAKHALMSEPGFEEGAMLESLSTRLYSLTAGRQYDPELSVNVLSVLKILYSPEELATFDDLLDGFLSRHQNLRALYKSYLDDDRCAVLLFQPESLAIFERLDKDPFTLREVWDAALPSAFLDELGAVWGAAV